MYRLTKTRYCDSFQHRSCIFAWHKGFQNIMHLIYTYTRPNIPPSRPEYRTMAARSVERCHNHRQPLLCLQLPNHKILNLTWSPRSHFGFPNINLIESPFLSKTTLLTTAVILSIACMLDFFNWFPQWDVCTLYHVYPVIFPAIFVKFPHQNRHFLAEVDTSNGDVYARGTE